jgi:dTDP-4-dehydrorhamnose reductase
MRKLLITGASGFLGLNLIRVMKDEFDIYVLYNKHPVEVNGCKSYQLDLTKKEKLVNFVKKVKPDTIIHAAALANVGYCESNKEEAYKVNVETTRTITDICEKQGIRIVYPSTEYVFDGNKKHTSINCPGIYNERDKPNPINYYGVTKYEAEKIVMETKNFSIIRLCMLYGWNLPFQRKNFVTWVIEELKNQKEVKAVVYQYHNPTYILDAVESIKTISLSDETGIFHVAGRTCLNKFELAVKIARAFNLNEELIKPSTLDSLEKKSFLPGELIEAKRPKNCCLNTEKVRRKFNLNFLTIEEGLNKMREEYIKKSYQK